MRYRKYNNRKPQARTITVKYAGPCACCGAEIKAGQMADYYPVGTLASRTTGAIAHVGGLEGNSPRCTEQLRRTQHTFGDPGYVDLDRMYEDACADKCGR